jgi:UDP:flavonoid glycosyltransferase YjiC (YdhE family)
MSRVIAAAGGVDAEFVLIRPDRAAAAVPRPGNVRTVEWVALPAVLGRCAGVIHHGGAGTTLAALHAGVPQLVVNGPGDRRHNGSLIAARGAGLAVDEAGITADLLRRLITDGGLAANAAAVRDEMASMPSPEQLVSYLEALP